MHVVITGANRGIGAELAKRYDARGDRVTGTARSRPTLAPLDVTDPKSVESFATSLGETPVDLLICNAGVYLDEGHTLENGFAPEIWEQTFAANVTGVFLTIRHLLANLRAAKGKIAIMSSQMASHERAPGGSYIYRASKAAALNLGRNLASDLRGDGIAVGIYHPGWVQTDMGGASADISVEQSAAGLMTRFDELGLESTGEFLTYDGQVHPY